MDNSFDFQVDKSTHWNNFKNYFYICRCSFAGKPQYQWKFGNLLDIKVSNLIRLPPNELKRSTDDLNELKRSTDDLNELKRSTDDLNETTLYESHQLPPD